MKARLRCWPSGKRKKPDAQPVALSCQNNAISGRKTRIAADFLSTGSRAIFVGTNR